MNGSDDSSMELDVLALLKFLRKIQPQIMKPEAEVLTELVDAVEVWFESDDPRDMGWVSDGGLP